MTREEIIATATRIAEIRQELSRLQPLQKELRHLEAILDGLADTPQPHTGDPNNLVDRVVQTIDSDSTREWNAEGINALLEAKLPSIRAALSKALGLGRITKRGRGRFGSVVAGQQELGIVTAVEDENRAA